LDEYRDGVKRSVQVFEEELDRYIAWLEVMPDVRVRAMTVLLPYVGELGGRGRGQGVVPQSGETIAKSPPNASIGSSMPNDLLEHARMPSPCALAAFPYGSVVLA
jgi:hypothetical protein